MYKYTIAIFLLILISCQQDSKQISSPQIAFKEAPPNLKSPEQKIIKNEKLIKEGNISAEVNDIEKTKQKIDKLITSYNAYYQKEDFKLLYGKRTYQLVLKIPFEQFDLLSQDVEKCLDKIKSKKFNTKDVTDKYVDLEIRLKNNEAYLSRYNDILKSATSIEEILNVQSEVRRLEENIESKKGQLKLLDDKVAYSTLHIELSEIIVYEKQKKDGYFKKLALAFNSGKNLLLETSIFMVSIWPFLVFLCLLFFYRRKITLNKLLKFKKEK